MHSFNMPCCRRARSAEPSIRNAWSASPLSLGVLVAHGLIEEALSKATDDKLHSTASCNIAQNEIIMAKRSNTLGGRDAPSRDNVAR
jgi:hypothetical protein